MKGRLGFVFIACLALLTQGGAADLHAQTAGSGWASVGAAGIIDEASQGKVALHDTGSVAITASLNYATVTLRYPVSNASAIRRLDDTEALCMFVSARDAGTGARVILKLQEVDNFTGVLRTIVTWDSDSPDASYFGGPFEKQGNADYRPGIACAGIHNGVWVGGGLEWYHNAYFVELTLVKSPPGNPGLKMVKLQFYQW